MNNKSTTLSTGSPIDEDKLLNTAQAAELANVSEEFFLKHRKVIPCVRIGKKIVRYRRSDLREWFESQNAR